jgi:tetratricopeptide (TPR) repeat protein
MRQRTRRVSGVALVLWLVAGAAVAGPKEDAARAAVNRGTAAYNLGKYDEAARHYEDAYTLIQDPAVLFNLGQAYRLGEKPEKAITAYRSFLRTAPGDSPVRGQAERRLRELEAAVADQKRRPPEPAPTAPPPPPASRPAPAPYVGGREVGPMAPEPDRPFYARAWFWSVVAGVVAAGTAGIIYSRRPTEDPLSGNTAPGVVNLK